MIRINFIIKSQPWGEHPYNPRKQLARFCSEVTGGYRGGLLNSQVWKVQYCILFLIGLLGKALQAILMGAV